MFRNNFTDFFSNKSKSNFELYEYQKTDFERFVEDNFRVINGKCFITKENKLILAKHTGDDTLNNLLVEFKVFELK